MMMHGLANPKQKERCWPTASGLCGSKFAYQKWQSLNELRHFHRSGAHRPLPQDR